MEHIGTKSTVHKLYSKYSPLAWTHARCLPRHWSIVSSKIDCSRPHHIDEPPFQFIHYMDLSGRHDAAWQRRSRNPQDWDLGCLEATALPQESMALFDAAVQPLHVRGAVCRCTAGTKSLPDTLRIADSSMTSLWRREAEAKIYHQNFLLCNNHRCYKRFYVFLRLHKNMFFIDVCFFILKNMQN